MSQQPPNQGQPFPFQGNYPPPQQGYQQFPQSYPPPQHYQQPPMMQPAPTPAPKKRRTGLIIGVVVLVVALALCGIVGSVLSHGATAVSTTTATTGNTTTQAPVQTVSKIGDAVTVGSDWSVTINSVKANATGSNYVTPKAGMKFLIVALSMKNLSSKTQTVSSILLFTLRGDDGTKYDITIYPDAGSQIDGNVDAGQPAKGVIVYEVPVTQKHSISRLHPTS